MSQPKSSSVRGSRSQEQLPGHARVLGEHGPATAAAVSKVADFVRSRNVLMQEGSLAQMFETLAEAFKEGWDDNAAEVLTDNAFLRYLERKSDFDLLEAARWIRIHRGNPQDVIACLDIIPPKEISILRLLSRAGSQKVVFLANWQEAQREVVVKRFIGDGAERLLPRERQIHPLSMGHPNIIETHTLQNEHGETFLVERRLPEVLSDEWRSHGVHEAANLLRDIASALSFLRGRKLIHGDIKPDNIGFEDGAYILLDFGICRPEGQFGPDSTATGSLRTRAPELLLGQGQHSEKSDIWALGATVFNSIVERFPLFDKGEAPPRGSHPVEREKFERELGRRVNEEWDHRIDFGPVPDPLRQVLQKILFRTPAERPSAAQLVNLAEANLAAFLRPSGGSSMFSPAEEVDQLHSILPQKEMLALMPGSEKHKLRVRLDELRNIKGLPDTTRDKLKNLSARLSA